MGTAPAASAGPAQPRGLARCAICLGALPVLLSVGLVAGLQVVDPGDRRVYEPPLLLPLLNTVFLFGASAVVAASAARGYLLSGSPTLLLLGTGGLAFGLGAAAAGWLVRPAGANAGVAVFCLSLLLAAACHAVGALFSLQRWLPEGRPAARRHNLAVAYVGVLGLVGLLSWLTAAGRMPPFFSQPTGATLLRQVVLVAAFWLLTLASIHVALRFDRVRAPFLYWYAIALALLAVSTVGLLLIRAVGSPMNWAARGAQYFAGVYLVLALLTTSRQAKEQGIMLEEAMAELFRGGGVFWQDLMSTVQEAIIACNDGGHILQWNPAATRTFGYSPSEVLGKNLDTIWPEWRQAGRDGPAAGPQDAQMRRRDGKLFPAEVSISARRLPIGQVVILVVRDITRRKQTEAALLASEARYRNLFETMQEGFFLAEMVPDRAGRALDYCIIEVNPALEHLAEMPRAEIVGRTARELLPDLEQGWIDTFCGVATTGRPAWREGFARPFGRWYSTTAYSPAPGQVAVLMADITDRKLAERELFATNERLVSLLDALPVGVSFSEDPHCERVTGNKECLAQFEVGQADNLSPSAADEAAAGRRVRYFREGRELSATELPLQRAVAENREISPIVLEIVLPSGRRWVAHASGAPLHDIAGTVVGGVAVTVDITARRQAEQALLEAERSRARLAEHLAAEIGHRTKNNLTIIAGLLQMQAARSADGEMGPGLVFDAIRRIHAFGALHQQLYETHTDQVDLVDLINRIARVDRDSLGEADLAISVRGAAARLPAKAGTNLCVMVNELLTNAIKHGAPVRGRRRVAVRVGQANRQLILSVWSSGNPIAPGFDPAARQSTGMALICGLAGRYNGTFTLRPARGGTVARLVLDEGLLRAEG